MPARILYINNLHYLAARFTDQAGANREDLDVTGSLLAGPSEEVVVNARAMVWDADFSESGLTGWYVCEVAAAEVDEEAPHTLSVKAELGGTHVAELRWRSAAIYNDGED